MDLGTVISVAAAAASAIGVMGAIGSSFGRRHRLKLAAEVRDSIGADQLPAWEAMINRDAEAIIALSRQPILPALVSIFGMSGAAFAGFFLHGWRVRIPVMILSWIVAGIAGWMFGWHFLALRKSKRDEDSRRAMRQAGLELQLQKLETERLRKEVDDLQGQVALMGDFRLVQSAWSSSALYIGGAPMADVKRARDPMVGADSYPDPKLVLMSRSWRVRARLRRYSLRRRAYDFTRYKAVHANYEAKYDIADRRRAESQLATDHPQVEVAESLGCVIPAALPRPNVSDGNHVPSPDGRSPDVCQDADPRPAHGNAESDRDQQPSRPITAAAP